MVFYVAKGAPDACGRGCDRWIAVEGQIDSGAAPRVPEIPGARSRTAICRSISPRPAAISTRRWRWARMLRERPGDRPGGADGGAGNAASRRRTARSASSSSSPAANCTANSGPATRCAIRHVRYLILGATTREIAPDALLAVHSPKVVAAFPAGMPTAQMQAAATRSAAASAPTAMLHGIHRQRWASEPRTARSCTAPSNSRDMHVLTREEIYRFGIDRARARRRRRGRSRTSAAACVRKIARSQKNDGRIVSVDAVAAVLLSTPISSSWIFSARPWRRGSFPRSRFRMAGRKPLYFSVRAGQVGRGSSLGDASMTRASVQSLGRRQPQFDLTETSQAPDGRRLARSAKFSSEGLAARAGPACSRPVRAPQEHRRPAGHRIARQRREIVGRRPFIPRRTWPTCSCMKNPPADTTSTAASLPPP